MKQPITLTELYRRCGQGSIFKKHNLVLTFSQEDLRKLIDSGIISKSPQVMTETWIPIENPEPLKDFTVIEMI